MTVEPLSLPASLRFYRSSRANRSALDLIISKPELPADLRWDEVLAFHDAAMAAQRVQLDYFALLYKVWQATWGTAKKELLRSTSEPTVAELSSEWGLSVSDVWYQGLFCRIDLRDRVSMWCGVSFADNEKEISLYFYISSRNGDYLLSDGLNLSADWLRADADHHRVTALGLCPFHQETFEVMPLTRTARHALEAALQAVVKSED